MRGCCRPGSVGNRWNWFSRVFESPDERARTRRNNRRKIIWERREFSDCGNRRRRNVRHSFTVTRRPLFLLFFFLWFFLFLSFASHQFTRTSSKCAETQPKKNVYGGHKSPWTFSYREERDGEKQLLWRRLSRDEVWETREQEDK